MMTRRVSRFAHLPRPGYQTVYAVLLTNGWVKVGCTYSLQNRFSLLENEMRRKHGIGISEFYHGVHIDGFNYHKYAERTLRKHIHKFAEPLPGSQEFFGTVDFCTACRLVDEVSRYALRGEPKANAPKQPAKSH